MDQPCSPDGLCHEACSRRHPTIRLCCQNMERSQVVSIATHDLCLSDVTAGCVSTLESVCEKYRSLSTGDYQSCFSSIDAGQVKDRTTLWSTIGTFHSLCFTCLERFVSWDVGFAFSVMFRVLSLFVVEICDPQSGVDQSVLFSGNNSASTLVKNFDVPSLSISLYCERPGQPRLDSGSLPAGWFPLPDAVAKALGLPPTCPSLSRLNRDLDSPYKTT